MDLLSIATQHLGTAIQRLDRASALAIGLVTSLAIGGVDFFTARDQSIQLPNFTWVIRQGGEFFLLSLNPSGIVFLREYFDMEE